MAPTASTSASFVGIATSTAARATTRRIARAHSRCTAGGMSQVRSALEARRRNGSSWQPTVTSVGIQAFRLRTRLLAAPPPAPVTSTVIGTRRLTGQLDVARGERAAQEGGVRPPSETGGEALVLVEDRGQLREPQRITHRVRLLRRQRPRQPQRGPARA